MPFSHVSFVEVLVQEKPLVAALLIVVCQRSNQHNFRYSVREQRFEESSLGHGTKSLVQKSWHQECPRNGFDSDLVYHREVLVADLHRNCAKCYSFGDCGNVLLHDRRENQKYRPCSNFHHVCGCYFDHLRILVEQEQRRSR